MKILIAPDSFKGSLSAKNVAKSLVKGIEETINEIEIVQTPLADGGEGTAEALISGNLEFEKHEIICKNPLGKPTKAELYFNPIKKLAVLNMSSASGLGHIAPPNRNILASSTFGTGELINKALSLGTEEIMVGLGGSATCDAGIGLAAALGYKFFDKNNNEVYPIPLNFKQITKIERAKLHAPCIIKCLYDVDIELLGRNGTVAKYTVQKGATQKEMEFLNSGLDYFSNLIIKELNIATSACKGDGAAGGLGFGMRSFLDAQLCHGFTTVATVLQLDDAVKKADLVIGGEGSIDLQTMDGKVLKGLSEICKRHNKPLILVAGKIANQMVMKDLLHAKDAFQLVNDNITEQQAIENANVLLEKTGSLIAQKYLMNE